MTDKERVQAQIDQNERDQQKLKAEQERLEAELKKLHEPKRGDVRCSGCGDAIVYLGEKWFNNHDSMRKEKAGYWNEWGEYKGNVFEMIKEIG